MSPVVRLLTNPPCIVPAREGQTVLEAVLDMGQTFPHDCQAGNCGSCKCELVQGEIFALDHSIYALSKDEQERRLILACRSQVWSDCVVRPLAPEDAPVHPIRLMQCRVEALDDLTHEIKELRLSIVSGGPFNFSAGQYANLKFNPGLRERSYSMTNLPKSRELVFHVRCVRDGQATAHLFERTQVGDHVDVAGPFGSAYFRPSHRGPILAIAGGSGCGVMKCIVDQALGDDPHRIVHLYIGVRDERDIYLDGPLAELAAKHPGFTYQFVLSSPCAPTQRRQGLVGDAVAADFVDLTNFLGYAAGPPAMIEHLQRIVTSRGLEPTRFHADAFWSTQDFLETGVGRSATE
jgi:ferredoxin-NAD(P)+ reductase (naphthalene dioxygenase ferredoxin-specific)